MYCYPFWVLMLVLSIWLMSFPEDMQLIVLRVMIKLFDPVNAMCK